MNNFILSRRLTLSHDQDIEEVKSGFKQILEHTIEVSEISPSNDHFYFKGSTGGLFDLIRNTRVFAEIDMISEETKTDKDLRIVVKGNAVVSYSMAIMYTTLFFLVLFAGLLPGSIETSFEKSSALDALVFILVGYYIKTEIDKSKVEAENHVKSCLDALVVRYSV